MRERGREGRREGGDRDSLRVVGAFVVMLERDRERGREGERERERGEKRGERE